VRRSWKTGLTLVLIAAVLFVYTISGQIKINSAQPIEFGQGLELTVACDTSISASLGTTMDSVTGNYYISSVTLSDLSTQLHNRTVKVYLIGTDGSVLNSKLQFSVGTDGLTYTSTRSHVDNLDAFTAGAGPKAEMGSSSINFNNLLNEENPGIKASDFQRVNLETSGYGKCSVPVNNGAITLYIDAPSVQGSYIPEQYPSASATDTYNSVTTDNSQCPANGVVGTYSGGNCFVLLSSHANPYVFGGAISTDSQPHTGGGQTNQSPSAGVFNSTGETISFSSRKNYIGFWWSAGSTGNIIKFYRGSTLVATATGDQVYTALPRNSTKTAIDNSTTYSTNSYYGHPANSGSWDTTEPFVYIHGFAENGFNFDKVVISTTGNGFEYDNLTVANLSNDQLTPKSTLVKIQTYNYTG
jgi:hypothetical protein